MLQSKKSLIKKELKKFPPLTHVGDTRQKGFMIEIVKDKKTKTPYPIEKRMGFRVILEAKRRGAILRPLGNVVVLMPHLSIKEAELMRL